MKRLGLRFAPGAGEQLEVADAWWRTHRSAAPDLFAEELMQGIDLLRASPGLGAEYPNEQLPGTRRFLLTRARFHLYYVVREETLVVVAIWSAIRGHGPPLDG